MNLQIGVKLLIRNDQGEFLFLKRGGQYEMSAGTQESWDIPGGRINPEESLHIAMQREIREEVGIDLPGKPTLLEAQDIFVETKDLHVVRLTYMLDVDQLAEITLSDEHTDSCWAKLTESIELNIEPYLRTVLDTLK